LWQQYIRKKDGLMDGLGKFRLNRQPCLSQNMSGFMMVVGQTDKQMNSWTDISTG
jgi:hypothetical protein